MNAHTCIHPSPTYEFSIAQRAALQILDHALGYVAGMATTANANNDIPAAQAALDAGHIIWRCREAVLREGERQGGAQ